MNKISNFLINDSIFSNINEYLGCDETVIVQASNYFLLIKKICYNRTFISLLTVSQSDIFNQEKTHAVIYHLKAVALGNISHL